MEQQFTLYGLVQAHQTAIEGGFVIDEETGEILFDPSNVDELELTLAQKAEAVCCFAKGRRSLADALEAEAKVLMERAKAARKQADSTNEYLLRCIEENGGRIETTRALLSTRRSSQVEVIDEDALPEQYKRVKTTVSPDKTKIKAAINAGIDVPGAVVIEKVNLQTK